MSHLTTLSLRLGAYSRQLIEDHQNTFFLCVFTHLKYLTQLQKLEFTIVGNFLLKDIHTEHLALFLQDLKNLETLELNLPHLESLSEVVISLAKGLRDLSGLKHLKIKCKTNKNASISYKAMEIFSNSLAHLQLKSLDLTFFDEQLSNPTLAPFQTQGSFAPLSYSISGFRDLSSLNLDLSVFNLSTQELKDFTLVLNSLHKLSSVSLVIPQLNSANDFEDLSSFLSCFKMMPNLNSLHLTFTGKNLCDQEVDVIARNLNGCRHLQRLQLFFPHAEKLSESCLDFLQPGFANLTKLERLKIKIGNEWEFGFDIVCKFLTGLISLKRLKELSFEGREIPSPLYTHYPMLESLQKLYHLKHLTKIVVNGYRYI